MGNILSQDEVDSLLDGINKGEVETEKDASGKDEEVKLFEFGRRAGPIHLKIPALGIVNERFVGFLKTSLSTNTGSVVDVNISDIESVTFGDYCRSIPIPTSLNIFKMEPLRGFSLLVLEASLVFAFVDAFFGGNGGGHVKLEGRAFTAIEAKIINKIVKLILDDLGNAWSEVHKLKMGFMRSEIDPQFAGITTPDDMAIVVKYSIDFGNTSGTMTICMPYSTIEPIREKLSHKYQSESMEVDKIWRRYIERRIGGVAINLSCTLGKATMTGRELLDIKVDDVIQLDQKITDPVIVNIEGIPKFKGYPGACNRKQAIRIEEKINKE